MVSRLKPVDEKDQSLVAKRARVAIELADGVNTAANKVEALAKSAPRDAKTPRLLGHARLPSRTRALNAFKRAYARDKTLLVHIARQVN